MTQANGLRLAYRGFVTGLAAGYAWLATAMAAAGLLQGEPLAPLRPLAAMVEPSAGGAQSLAFVLGFALVQLAGGMLGMCFAYFFGRFFTVRRTLAAAAPCFALLSWALLAGLADRRMGDGQLGMALAPLLATLAYGLLLGAGLPLRAEVLRYPEGSPST